jgi:hypothetical protein
MKQKAVNLNTAQGEIPSFTGEDCYRERRKFNLEVKEQIKISLLVQNQEKWVEHVKSLVQQGNFLSLTEAEKKDMIWKS